MVILILVGDPVAHDDGRTGVVVELDPDHKRARVKWNYKNLRTWISFKFLNRQATN